MTIDRNAFTNVAQSQTDTSLVSAVTARRIKVMACVLQAGATATTFVFNSKGAGVGTAISPSFALGANENLVLPWNPDGWFFTNTGEGLTCSTGAGATTGVSVNVAEAY